MGAMTYAVRDADWYEVQRVALILRTLDRDVAKDLRQRMKTEAVDPLARSIRLAGATSTDPLSRIAAKTVKTRAGNKPTLVGAATGTDPVGRAVFYGAEFGSQGERRTRYILTNRTWRGIVTRHTTRQFRPHRGRQGYWFHPTLRKKLPEATAVIWGIVNDAVDKVTGRAA